MGMGYGWVRVGMGHVDAQELLQLFKCLSLFTQWLLTMNDHGATVEVPFRYPLSCWAVGRHRQPPTTPLNPEGKLQMSSLYKDTSQSGGSSKHFQTEPCKWKGPKPAVLWWFYTHLL